MEWRVLEAAKHKEPFRKIYLALPPRVGPFEFAAVGASVIPTSEPATTVVFASDGRETERSSVGGESLPGDAFGLGGFSGSLLHALCQSIIDQCSAEDSLSRFMPYQKIFAIERSATAGDVTWERTRFVVLLVSPASKG